MPSNPTATNGTGDLDEVAAKAAASRSSCNEFSYQLAEMADGQHMLEAHASKHFETCLRCQAELAQYKKLRRALASLREHRFAPDEGLVQEILQALEPGGSVHRLQRLSSAARTRKAAYIGGIAAAATAGAAGAVVLATRYAAKQRLAG